MIETKYNVLIGKQVIARDMTLDNAVIFLKGLFNEYYNDHLLAVTIEVSDSCSAPVEVEEILFVDDEEFK